MTFESEPRPSQMDNYLFLIESQLNVREADSRKRKEFLDQRIKDLERYLYLRKLFDSDVGEGFDDFLEEERIDPGLYESYDAIFGYRGQETALATVAEIEAFIERVKALDVDTSYDLKRNE